MPKANPDHHYLITAQNVDLSNCDREQVQFCGAIQPHGALVAVEEVAWTILHISGNSESMLGRAPEELLGGPLERLFGVAQVEQLRRAMAAQRTLTCPPVRLMVVRLAGGAEEMHLFAHRNDDGVLILEFEAVSEEGSVSSQDFHSEVRTSIAELQRTESVQSFFDLAVMRIRQFTGYDRVLAYKFSPDGSGWVVAEDREEGLESYLGLHYPASDIPEPARRLFSKKWVSHLPSVKYAPVPLVPRQMGEQTLDLSYALMRSVSVMYSGYLHNMGVQSTMVLTLLRNGKLWGLISCMHHRAAKYVPYYTRVTAEVLAHLMSLTMASKEDLEDRESIGRMQGLNTTLREYMLRELDFQEGLLRHQPNLLSYFGSTGVVVFMDGQTRKLGVTPKDREVEELCAWLQEIMDQDQFSTDRLATLFPPASAFAREAAGLLALRLFAHEPHFILWFRPEVERTVHWAGDPRKPVAISRVNGEDRLMPRTSFALWKDSVRGSCNPWRESELAAAADLRRAIVDVILRKKAIELASSSDQLTRKNVELDAFAYIASHDLKEPLRGIQNYARFVLEDYEDRLDEEGKSKLRTMVHLTERMDRLIDDLLHYSRLGREEFEPESTDLLALLTDVVQSLSPRLLEFGVTVRMPQALPVVTVNPIMLQEVFANLITNAMKYNDKPDKWIEIGSLPLGTCPEGAESVSSEGTVVLYVKDNGIGVPQEHVETIFHMFRRLHARDTFGGGTGVGLTIARKILERHGGRIWLESEPGHGSTFYVLLPGNR
jgi:light-regulated signal transduction histidine kinase (bacteriophytochrome)